MAITKTVLTLASDGQADLVFEADGQQSSVSATGLDPETTYTARGYVIDDSYGRINSGNDMSFSTLEAGKAAYSDASGTWERTTAQLTFSCSWVSTYRVIGDSGNFSIIMSKTSDFSNASSMTASYTLSSGGLEGTISGNCTQQIPAAGSTYYVKCQITDRYREVLESQTFTFTVPVCTTPGGMSFSPHRQGENTWWMPTQIPQTDWEYYPKYKYIVYTADDWATYSRSQKKSWAGNAGGTGYEIFVRIYYPNDYKMELEVEDIYGNVFRTSQGYSVSMTKPYFGFGDNRNGSAYWWCFFNPNLTYDSAALVWENTGDSSAGEVDLMPISSNRLEGNITLPDGTYEAYVKVVYDGGDSQSDVLTATLQDRGYIEITDTSDIAGGEIAWSCTFETGTYQLESATLSVYDCEYEKDLAEGAEVTIDGNTMRYDTPIPIPEECAGDYLYVSVAAKNTGGYTNYGEYEIKLP